MGEKCCAGCRQPIRDPFIMQIGFEYWHEACSVCHACHMVLKDSCFKRDGKLLCRNDYERLYGIKCSVCNQLVKRELIMRVLGNIYHLRCFLCSLCGHPLQRGDQFIIRHGQLICSMDFDRDPMSLHQCMAFKASMSIDKVIDDENMIMISHAQTAADTARRGPKRPRTILTSHQRRAFKSSFEVSPKPCRKVRESLAKDLGLSVRVVQVWFQNQRAKIKKLQRRQQVQHQHPKSGGKEKDGEDDSLSVSSTDDVDSHAEDNEEPEVPMKKKIKKSKLPKAAGIKQLDLRLDEASVFNPNGEDTFANSVEYVADPFSLDSMTSFSISPPSSVYDLSTESPRLGDTSTTSAKDTMSSSDIKNGHENPIGSLYSMHSSYFDS